jgi:hypothetical protein
MATKALSPVHLGEVVDPVRSVEKERKRRHRQVRGPG